MSRHRPKKRSESESSSSSSSSESTSESSRSSPDRKKSGLKPLERDYQKLPSGNFNYPGLTRFYNIQDENSLLRAILNAMYLPYRTGILGGKPCDRDKMIRDLRVQLAEKLNSPLDIESKGGNFKVPVDGLTYYENLSQGEIKRLSSNNPELTLENMRNYLMSKNPLNLSLLEYLGDALNTDIYLIDLSKLDVKIEKIELSKYLYKGRDSVVIGVLGDHFETLGVKSGKERNTYFTPDSPLIKAIRKRRRELFKILKSKKKSSKSKYDSDSSPRRSKHRSSRKSKKHHSTSSESSDSSRDERRTSRNRRHRTPEKHRESPKDNHQRKEHRNDTRDIRRDKRLDETHESGQIKASERSPRIPESKISPGREILTLERKRK